MKKLFLTLTLFILFIISSCEKQNNTVNTTCPNLIQNVTLNDFPMDFYGVNEVEVVGEQLLINVTYGGGCEDHEFKLIRNNENPIDGGGQQIEMLYLSHNANNDVCFAQILEHHLCFDISNLLNDELLFFYHPDSLYNLNE
jgi:hypothetical protein|tara:strand:+ start:1446 stop:1868 length:423 start_codon:yes stop_codon:yes gene_type:complete